MLDSLHRADIFPTGQATSRVSRSSTPLQRLWEMICVHLLPWREEKRSCLWAGQPLAEWPGAGFGLWKLRLGLESSCPWLMGPATDSWRKRQSVPKSGSLPSTEGPTVRTAEGATHLELGIEEEQNQSKRRWRTITREDT